MCDFKPGDEVVCVDASGRLRTSLTEGATYTIATVFQPGSRVPAVGGRNLVSPFWGVTLADRALPQEDGVIGWRANRFRKVQRRDLTAWLSTSTEYEEPKRAPAKKRERAS